MASGLAALLHRRVRSTHAAEARQVDKTTPFSTSLPETTAGHSPVVAIFNSMDDTIDALRLAFETAGFQPVTAKLSEVPRSSSASHTPSTT